MPLVPPPLYALGAAVAQRALTPARPPSRSRRLAAGALFAAAAVPPTAAAAAFRREGTTVEPMDPSKASTLVTTGANRLTRNPMYLGLAGALTAHAVLRGSWPALLPVGAFVAVMDRVQVPAEEKALTESFGADYEAYRADVPRWVDRRTFQRLVTR